VVREIDTEHLGNERVTCCWQVGDVLVDPGPESTLSTVMDEIEDRAPRALLLTHIHLDHAGGTGALVRAFPDLPVYVHELGAPHLIDPSKLLPSAARLYGEENMDRMWGEIVPVPERNIRLLRGGETVEGFRVAYAPGHASHHVVYLHEDSGWVFTGDTAGVRIHREGPVVPPTPPPDIDVEAWLQSIDAIEAWDPAALALTHFGAYDDVASHLDALARRCTSRPSGRATSTRRSSSPAGASGCPTSTPTSTRRRPSRCGWVSSATGASGRAEPDDSPGRR
jgi:glyoxylase-like metal-dependent hydrolase (beta-lactamase superfamily II)